MERANKNLKDQCCENDLMMPRFAEDIRQMDIEVDRRRKQQEDQEQDNQRLRNELDSMKHLQSRFDQTRITLDEESARRVASEAEADRLRSQLEQV